MPIGTVSNPPPTRSPRVPAASLRRPVRSLHRRVMMASEVKAGSRSRSESESEEGASSLSSTRNRVIYPWSG